MYLNLISDRKDCNNTLLLSILPNYVTQNGLRNQLCLILQ
jgi:hypothetical protein